MDPFLIRAQVVENLMGFFLNYPQVMAELEAEQRHVHNPIAVYGEVPPMQEKLAAAAADDPSTHQPQRPRSLLQRCP